VNGTLGRLWELDWEWAPKGETRTLAEEFGIDTTKSLEEIYEKKLRKGKGLMAGIGKLFGSRA